MMNESKIGHREALTLLIALMSAKVFLSTPRNMALLGDSAGWIIVLIAGILSLIGFYFIISLIQKYPGKNLFQITEVITGKFFSKLINLFFFLFFLISTALFIRQFAESFIITILPQTPISVITIIFLILLMYGTLLGIETLTRVAWFFGPYLLLALMSTLVFSTNFDPQRLLPILGQGMLPIIKHSFNHVNIFSEILFLGIIAPLIRKKEKIFGIGFLSILISITIHTLVTAIVIGTFNYTSSASLIFPVFQLTRLITLGEFIQRVEAIFVFLWFFTAAIQTGALFYGTVVSYSQIFKIKNYRPLVFPMAILILSLSMILSSMTNTVNWDEFIIGKYYSIVAFGLPALLWILSILFKKKSGDING